VRNGSSGLVEQLPDSRRRLAGRSRFFRTVDLELLTAWPDLAFACQRPLTPDAGAIVLDEPSASSGATAAGRRSLASCIICRSQALPAGRSPHLD
jgi:hypothetical protein